MRPRGRGFAGGVLALRVLVLGLLGLGAAGIVIAGIGGLGIGPMSGAPSGPPRDSAPAATQWADSVAQRPRAAPLRLVALGTSLTAGQGWPAQVAQRLGPCLGRPVTMQVIARPGALSSWGLAQLDAIAAAAPDLVLIELAINDADLRDGLWLGRSAEVHRTLIAGLQALPEAPGAVLMTMSPARGLRGWVRPRLGAYYGLYRDLAAQTGAGLVDLYPRWMALAPQARGLGADGLHPDAAVADPLIAAALVPYIAASLGQVCR